MGITFISQWTSWTKGGSTEASRTFFITSTVRGGLYHVSRWLAGSWIVLKTSANLASHTLVAQQQK
jgi:hypothetical protein